MSKWEYVYSGVVRYSDTDQMGIAHHSRFIPWLEDARIALLNKKNLSLKELENKGFYCPVVTLDIKYHLPLFFEESFTVSVSIQRMTKVRFSFIYEIVRGSEKIATGSSTHCIVDKAFSIIPLKKVGFLDESMA